MATIENLPIEIIEEIFQLINFKELQTNLVLVCKSWFNIIRQSVKLSSEIDDLQSLEALEYVLSPSWPTLKVLTLVDNIRNTNTFISTLSQFQDRFKASESLEELRIKQYGGHQLDEEGHTYYFKTNETFKVFSKHFAMKKEDFPLHWSYQTIIEVSKPIQLTFKQNIEQTLDLTCDTHFAELFSRVQDLCIVTLEFPEVFEYLLRQIPRLERLFLKSMTGWLMNRMIQETWKVHPGLKEIEMYGNGGEDINFGGILKFQKLETIDLDHIPLQVGTEYCEDEGFLMNLKTLFLKYSGGATKEDWNKIIATMPNLKKLVRRRNSIFPNMDPLSDFLAPLGDLPKLNCLSGIGFLPRDRNEDEVIELVKKFTNVDCHVQLTESIGFQFRTRDINDFKALVKPSGHTEAFFVPFMSLRAKYPMPK